VFHLEQLLVTQILQIKMAAPTEVQVLVAREEFTLLVLVAILVGQDHQHLTAHVLHLVDSQAVAQVVGIMPQEVLVATVAAVAVVQAVPPVLVVLVVLQLLAST
jgi:predicted DCC family thiol-disulfide oxidoreductase YuxK